MIIKKVTQIGNPLIRAKAKKVANLKSEKIQQTIVDLIDSMRHHNIIGMAAPQIGRSFRIFVSEIRKTKFRKGQNVKNTDQLRIYVNPEIVWYSKRQIAGYEGCGSVAFSNLFGKVKRPKSIIIQAQNKDGEGFKLKASSLLAKVIQHEYDHLDGIVFTDKADSKSYMSRNEYLAKFKK